MKGKLPIRVESCVSIYIPYGTGETGFKCPYYGLAGDYDNQLVECSYYEDKHRRDEIMISKEHIPKRCPLKEIIKSK